jgi:predicted membrane channel-forming protein YqfA (hemolysin III family)
LSFDKYVLKVYTGIKRERRKEMSKKWRIVVIAMFYLFGISTIPAIITSPGTDGAWPIVLLAITGVFMLAGGTIFLSKYNEPNDSKWWQ